MPRTAEQLHAAITALEAQRAVLGDAVVDVALGALRAQLLASASSAHPAPPAPLARATAADLQAPSPALPHAPQPAQSHLSQVSVLFLDIVGSTALSRHLDPEDVQAVMDNALRAFTAVVDAHGGRVLQYAGDSLLAAFGVDEVHEDDAERAVLAGLGLLHQAGVQADLVQRRVGQGGFGVRVGISSGSVLLGGGVDGEGTIRGNTVNIAARMEQTAPAGALRICQDTWRLVRGLFEVQAQPPLQVKGQDEPMQTYLVHGVAPAGPAGGRRGVQGVQVPLLGREHDLGRLQEAHDRLRQQGGVLSVLLTGDAGLGKSRLIDEFVAGLGAAASSRHARALERLRGRPFGLLRELLLAPLGLHDTGDPLLARQAWLQWARPLLGDAGSAAVLGQLLGLPFDGELQVQALQGDARALRDRAFFHAVQLLGQGAGVGLVVLVLDDLHWADEGSLDFVDHLHRAPWPLPVLLLLMARPQLLERRPAWAGPDLQRRRLDLQPLDDGTSLALAQALLQRLPEVPPQLPVLLAQGAEGNPFFLEELVNMLIDQGAILVHEGHWSLQTRGLPGLRLPATLKGVLQARMDALPPDQRHALQMAAVAGPVFWDQALGSVDMQAVAVLGELAGRQLVEHHEQSRLDGAQEYGFRHPSLHRVAYDSVLRRVKSSAHATLARWLAAQPGHESLQDQIAEHHERAGEAALACQAWQRAAGLALARFALVDALAQAERALALVEPGDLVRRLQITELRMRAHHTLGQREGLTEAVAAMQGLAQALGDAAWLSQVATWRGRLELNYGDPEQGLALAREAFRLAPAEALERRARAMSDVFTACMRLARWDEVDATAAHALALAREAGHRPLEASILNQLGMTAFDRGDLEAATSLYQQALALHRAEGHLLNEGGTSSNLAFVAMATGDFHTARQQFLEAAALLQRVGQLQHRSTVHINLGIVALNLGEPAEALALMAPALEVLRAAGDRWAEAAALRVQGQAAAALGQHGPAREWLRASRDLFEQLKMPHLALEAVAALVQEALQRGDIAAAASHAEAILAARAVGVGIEGTDEPMRIPLAVWQALQAAGDPRAPAVLAEARAELQARALRVPLGVARQRFLQAVEPHRQLMAGANPVG